jgi:3-methyladenine DNA glycosylase/8-oxoguanine DNA glycosylase
VTTPVAVRRWRPEFPVDLAGLLAPLRRGRGDPAFRRALDGYWLAANTAAGPGTLALALAGDEVLARAWGPGAEAMLAGVPALLGAEDDDSGFRAHHELIDTARRRMPWLRLGATGRVWDLLIPAILEQKVTGHEARRSWRELCGRFGERAPGPVPREGQDRDTPLRVPPTPSAIAAITDWQWHQCGVDGARRRTLIAVASVANRLERAAELRGVAGRQLLQRVPGIGVWTAAEVAQRAWGDPDAVSVGDFHIPAVVGHALVGRALDDTGMLEVLAPYAPQRQRAVRYVEAIGVSRPRFGPRFPARDYRAI